MDCCQHAAAIRKRHDLATDFAYAEWTTGDAPHSSCAERDNDIRLDKLPLEIQPPVAAVDLISIRPLMQTPLAARFKLEMLDGIGHENRIALDAGVFQCLRKHAAARTDTWPPLLVVLIAGLLANHHDSRPRRSFARHRLCRMLVEWTARAFFFGTAQRFHLSYDWCFGHYLPPQRQRNAPAPVPLKILLDPGGLHVLTPVADIPFAPGAETAQLIGAAIDRYMDDR